MPKTKKKICNMFLEVSEKLPKTISETSDYTDLFRLHRFFRRVLICVICFYNLCNHKIRLFQNSLLRVTLIALIFNFVVYNNFPCIGISFEGASWKEKIQKKEEAQVKQFNEDLKALRKRNPFNPPFAPFDEPAQAPTLALTGIVWGEDGKPAAIINDMIVSEGDVIKDRGIKVKKITENSVILVEKDKEYTLRLKFDYDEGTTEVYKDNAF